MTSLPSDSGGPAGGPGALREAAAVFVDGCALPVRWRGRPGFTVLELGFGSGVNFLATLAAWRADPARPARLHFLSTELFPISAAELAKAHVALGLDGPDAAALVARWPLRVPGLHRLEFADGAVTLTLGLGEAETLASALNPGVDAFFLDGFAPARNARTGSTGQMKALARLARAGATLVSRSTAQPVRDALAAAGFAVSLAPGQGARHERLDATYAPRWRSYPPPPDPPTWPSRTAIVVGAGLAGCAVAQALARRGWQVTLVDEADAPVRGGSSQPAVADHLHLSPDDNVLARLTRAALLLAPRESPIGKLQVATDERDEAHQRAMVESLEFPPEFVRSLDASQASDACGLRLARGGLWLPMCGAASPLATSAHQLAGAGAGVVFRGSTRVERLQRAGELWCAIDASDRTIAMAPVVVLANAGDAARLAGLRSASLRRVRGQTTLLAAPALAALRSVLGGSAYACPLPDGRTLLGSTFDDLVDTLPDPEADRSNLRRLERMLAPGSFDAESAAAHCVGASLGFRYTPKDRLPLIGELPDEPATTLRAAEFARNDRLSIPRQHGLWGAFGFGSRGLLWACLAAQMIAAAVDGAPAPIERDLAAAVDPARFLRRGLRTRRIR